MSKKIAIIGSGFGGLSAAALLAKEGFAVTVFEKNEQPGGRASVLKKEGFTFDMGPSWFMMPDVFDRFFGEFGLKTASLLDLVRLDPEYRVYFEKDAPLDIPATSAKAAKLFESIEPGAGSRLKEFLMDSQLKYELAINSVLYRNIDSLMDLASPEMIRHGRLDMFLPVHKLVSKYFKHPKLQQILEYNLVFLGCSPDNAPALFSMMAHVDFNLGIYYPMGGMGKLVEVMVDIGKNLGVEYIYNCPVESIEVRHGKASGLMVGGKTLAFDAIISNADLKYTEDILSDSSYRSYSPDYWRSKVMAPSAFLLYLGVKGKTGLKHHNLYFGNDWKPHFRDIFDSPKWPLTPSLYINNPSAADPSLAPKGHEALMVLVPIAPGLEENEVWKKSYAQYILSYIDEKMKLNICDSLVYQSIFSVSDFATRYNSYQGNALGGLAHTLFQSALWRPSNVSPKVANLFFAGANTVPGIGVPPAIISGHLVRDRIVKHFG